MILILNDTAHCWENETSVAASPFECPCEFIKSTSFPRSNSDLHSCTSLKEYSRTKVFNVEQNAVSISLFGFTVHDNEPHQIFIMWKEIISYYTFLISRHFYCADSTRSGRKRRNVMLCRLLSEPDVAFQGIWHRSYPSERPRCPAEKIFAVFLKINALLKWLFFFFLLPTTDTKCTDVSVKPRVRRKTTEKWQASWWEFFAVTLLSPPEWKKEKPTCAANINKPSFRWRMTQGVTPPPPPPIYHLTPTWW